MNALTDTSPNEGMHETGISMNDFLLLVRRCPDLEEDSDSSSPPSSAPQPIDTLELTKSHTRQ